MYFNGQHLTVFANFANGDNPSYVVPVLLVTVNEENNKASHTAPEIYNHVQLGGVVFLRFGDGIFNLNCSDNESASFTNIGSDYLTTDFTIDKQGDFGAEEIFYVSQAQFGDISAALDRIIEIQEELIGV